VALVAGSRLRVELADASRIDSAQLSALGAAGVMPLPGNLLHLVLGADAPRYAAALQM
jgi:phosphotransferase system IIB component